jgi:NACHT domain
MLEWLTAAVGTELAKKVCETVLELGKGAAEDYVKDFFKSCLSEGVAALNVATLQKSSGQAVGEFLKLFVEELEYLDVHSTSIEHFYWRSLKQFAKDKKVRGLLGEPFATDCKRLKSDSLQTYWQQYQPQGTPFPTEFDWQRIGKEYVRKVKAIIKADADLSRLLQLELEEQRNAFLERMAGLPKGFDLEQYRANLDKNYGGLKLHAIDCTDNQYRMKLWRMFIEQTAREALPPSRYDLPWDLKRRFQADGLLEADLTEVQLERYRRDYFGQPLRKILKALGFSPSPPNPLSQKWGEGEPEAIAPLLPAWEKGLGDEGKRAVVLGDPGAGKSTLLQYLALRWVEGDAAELPLLIELREYVGDRAKVTSFLEFLNKGCGADWQFDEVELDRYLRENPTLVMFDGLDEVFEPAAYNEVAGEIVRFAQQYPLAQVVVTSRIIGYNPDRLQHAEFRHWTFILRNVLSHSSNFHNILNFKKVDFH